MAEDFYKRELEISRRMVLSYGESGRLAVRREANVWARRAERNPTQENKEKAAMYQDIVSEVCG